MFSAKLLQESSLAVSDLAVSGTEAQALSTAFAFPDSLLATFAEPEPMLAQHNDRRDTQRFMGRLQSLCADTFSVSETGALTNPFALLLLDLDRFQILRCSLGVAAAETLLNAFIARIQWLLPATSCMVRFQEGEFAILVEATDPGAELGSEFPEAITALAQQIHQCLRTPFTVSGLEIFLTVSIGITTSALSQLQPTTLLSDVELAVCQAKVLGGNSSVFFDAALRERTMEQFHLENDLRLGLLRQEFFLEYQPIVALDSRQLTGFEALVRWQHPRRGIVSPTEFIPVAESTGIIVPLGWWVLQEACQQIKDWHEQFPDHSALTINVNLSGQQFSQPDFIEKLDAVLEQTGLPGGCLKLEITETVLMENAEFAATVLDQLRERGIHLCIDDFGTGYSSLSYLQRFEINTLKIDRSFIARIGSDPKSMKILQMIVLLAQQLDMDVVAEGIEIMEQYWQLRALQCQHGQGYLFKRPLKSVAATALLSNPVL
jgi:EAL domain-containing protein (putative c-di-GMP-specific phosphodiesterase class I)/GGDEF domain-containing protein